MKLVVVEDSELIRTQLERILALQPRIRIAGSAGDEESAVDLILAERPDAVLLDLALSPGSGVRVLQRIREAGSGARVLVLTNNASEALRASCEALGISGFFDKSREVPACLDRLFAWLPPLPDNESRRLAALLSTQLLDTPESEIYDNLARLARAITGMPMALITLVDNDRQWFLSHDGIAGRETSRTIAFCAHAILRNELMEVPDALVDPRFRDNPLVVGEPHVRCYAGVPLVLPSGEALGTLCVLDSVPRRLDTPQRDALRTLARSVVGEIELRRRVIHLEHEVERRQLAEAHIHHLATRDPLTALPNRVTFRDRLVQQLKLAARQRGGLAVMFVDLDRFKLINDTLGHDVGDAALLVAAERLAGTLRDSDTVARLGGDEFAVLLADQHDPAEAMQVAAKVIAALREPFQVRHHRLHVDASVGISLFPRHGDTADLLLRHADLAMYEAKRLGGNRASLFVPQLDERAEAAMALENDLRDAMERDELVVHYQPQAYLGDGGLYGLEALVRWNHPHMGLLAPGAFIPLAEERGCIREIGRRVLDKALAQLAVWDAAGLHIPRVAVNVSAAELRADYAEVVAAALQRHGLAARRLELEITESALTADGIEAMNLLGHLREIGVSIAVDDFGVGYSSLGKLRRLPIDALKIDKSFVDEVHENHEDAAIVKAVVTMARALALRTVAEGAEDAHQIAALERLGCDCMQGYVLARPLAAGDVPAWVQRFDAGQDDLPESQDSTFTPLAYPSE